jgi:hypothetical protein
VRHYGGPSIRGGGGRGMADPRTLAQRSRGMDDAVNAMPPPPPPPPSSQHGQFAAPIPGYQTNSRYAEHPSAYRQGV